MTAQDRIATAMRGTLLTLRETRQRQREDLVTRIDQCNAHIAMAETLRTQLAEIDAELSEIADRLSGRTP